MKTAIASFLTRFSLVALLALGFLDSGRHASAQTQFSAYPLLSSGYGIGTNANILVNIVDPTSATGFRTKRASVAALFELLGLYSETVVTTNTVTNRFEFYTTNLYEPDELSTIFSNWLEGVTVHDRWEFYPTNLYAGIAVCGLSNILNPVVIPDQILYYPTNLYALDPYLSNLFTTNLFADAAISNYFRSNPPVPGGAITNAYGSNIWAGGELEVFFNTQLIATNDYASNYYATNLFAPTVTWTIDTTISNWFATTAPIVMGENTNFYGSNIFNLDGDYVSNWFNTQMIVTNSCAAAFYASNAFSAVEITHLDTTVSNWFFTNSVIIMGEQTNFMITNIWNGITNWIGELISTNDFGSNYFTTNIFYPGAITSNYNTTNITIHEWGDKIYRGPVTFTNVWIIGTNVVNILDITNILVAQGYALHTNTWPGPTNLIDLRFGDLYYRTFTPLSITGLTNKVRDVFGMVLPVMLTITNASDSNVTLTLPAGMNIPQRTNSLTISNASQFMLSIRYHPLAGTNAIRQQF